MSTVPSYIAVVLRIDAGSFATGFNVALQVLEEGRQMGETQSLALPAASDIPRLYSAWKETYRSFYMRAIQLVSEQETHRSQCSQVQTRLEEQVKIWFDQPEFINLSDRIQAALHSKLYSSIPIIIHSQTGDVEQDVLLRKLPWHLWSLFDRLRNAEVALKSNFGRLIPPLGSRIRVLAIFGSSEGGLQLQDEQDSLEQLRQWGAEVIVEFQPDRKTLHQRLFHETWDILYFAGHSFSTSEHQNGHLQVRDREWLSLNALRVDLSKIVERGLKLAIFNSCDGLGIADELSRLNVPAMIVMREPVPDQVARQFLPYFLTEFFQGTPLCLAVRNAREQLHWMESDQTPCPAASWLPILFQDPNQPQLVLPSAVLLPHQPESASSRSFRSLRQTPKWILIAWLILCSGFATTLWYFRSQIVEYVALPHEPAPFGTFDRFTEVKFPEGQFRYGGSTTWEPLAASVIPLIEQAAPQFQLESRESFLKEVPNEAPGSLIGLEMLNQGQVSFAHVSRIPTGYPALKPYAVAYTFKAIAVHPSTQIQAGGLTKRQIAGICAGEIKNWREVGGEDLPIQIFDRHHNEIKNSKLQETLGDQCETSPENIMKTPTEAIKKVSETPGGFYIGAAPIVVPQCTVKILPVINRDGHLVAPYKQSYPLDIGQCQVRPPQVNIEVFKNRSYLGNDLRDTLYVYVTHKNWRDLRAGVAYINFLRSREGQQLIEEAGYVSYQDGDRQ